MLLALRCLLAGLSLVLTEAHALSPAEIFLAIGPSVVVLEAVDETGRTIGNFSATVAAADTLVTVCNGIDSAFGLRVVRAAGSLKAKLQSRDYERNLCLISAPGVEGRPPTPAPADIVTGSRVYAVSNALGLGVGISDGIFSGKRKFPCGEYLQFTAPVSPGSEGGTLIDDQGRLLGIIDYRRRDGQNVNFAMPAAWLDQIRARVANNTSHQQQYERAQSLAGNKDWDVLLQHAESWAKAFPDSADPWTFLIRAAHEKKLADVELRGWKALYRIDPSQRMHGLGLGWQLALHQQYDEALELVRQLLANNSADGSAWYLQGVLQQAKGRFEDSEKSLTRAVELDPWLIEAYQSLARIAQARGNWALAIATWQRLAGLRINDAEAQWSLVNAYLLSGRPQKAWLVVERQGESQAGNTTYWYWRGRTLAALGAHDAACTAYRKSLDLKVDNAWSWGAIGFSRTEQRRLPEAIAAFREARRLAPDNEEWTYQLAIALKDGGRPEEALALTSELVANSPQQSRNWRQQGFVLSILDRPKEAVPALERSLQIEPRQIKVWSALIEVNHQFDRKAEARQAYEKLRGFDSAAAEAMYRQIILPDEAYTP